MHFKITLVKDLWITSCGNVTTAASGPTGLLSMKLLKYIFMQHNVWQKLLVFSLRFKEIITVKLYLFSSGELLTSLHQSNSMTEAFE